MRHLVRKDIVAVRNVRDSDYLYLLAHLQTLRRPALRHAVQRLHRPDAAASEERKQPPELVLVECSLRSFVPSLSWLIILILFFCSQEGEWNQAGRAGVSLSLTCRRLRSAQSGRPHR